MTLKSISYGMAAFILTILLFTLAAYIDEPFNPAIPKKLQAKLFKPIINLQPYNPT